MAESENKADLKRYRILEAATEIFSTKDYHEAKVEEIAKKAGVGKGTIYQYFPSKQAILDNLYLYRRNQYLDEVRELLLAKENVADILADLISFHVDNVHAMRILLRYLVANDDIEHMPPDEGLLESIEELTVLIWQRGVDTGEITECDPKIFGSYLVGVMMSAVVHIVLYRQTDTEVDLAKTKEKFVALALHGIIK